MLDLLQTTSAATIGVEIGSSSIRVLELDKKDGQYRVTAFGSQRLPEGVFQGQHIADIHKLSFAIREAYIESGAKSKSVVIAIPDVSVITKIIQLEHRLSESEREELVYLEADKHIPYPINEVSIDYEVLGQPKGNSKRDNVLIVATRAEVVSQLVELLKESDLQAKVIDVESFAVERACSIFDKKIIDKSKDNRIGIFDIGRLYTKLFVIEHGRAVFAKQEAFGTKKLLESLSERYRLPIDKVDTLYKRKGLPKEALEEVIIPFKGTVITQIKRALHLYYSTTEENNLDKILLFGEICMLDDMDKEVTAGTGIPALTINLLDTLSVYRKVNTKQLELEKNSLLLATGLALRKFEIAS